MSPLRYTGEHLDTESGQYHLRARQYEPSTGRFTAQDPAAPLLTDPYVSAYAYVNNQPTVLVDPSGMTPEWGDVWSATKGIARAGWDTGTGLAQSLNPANAAMTARDMRQAWNVAYDEGGFGLAINRTANPVYMTLESGAAAHDAWQCGDYEGAFYNGTMAGIHSGETLAFAYGGAKGFTGVRNRVGARFTAKAAPKGGRNVGAAYADDLPNLGDLKKMRPSQLKRYNIDAHQLKNDMLGGDISKFDIYRHGDQLYFVEKSTGQVVPAYTTLPEE